MKPRPIFNNVDIFITRRVHGQQFRLLPTKKTKAIIGYVLAVVADTYGIEITAICVMSNHWHAEIFDPFGNIANFTRDFHSFVARALNKAYGDHESMWSSSSQTSHVHPVTRMDSIGRIAYTLANPVKAGLVEYSHRWPGLCLSWPCTSQEFERPEIEFFRDTKKKADGRAPKWPATATLKLHRPRGFSDYADDELAVLIAERVAAVEAKERSAVFARGGGFLGARWVLRESRYGRPKNAEELGRISPRVASRDRCLRIERLEANRLWRDDYQASLERYMTGDRDVVFPYGTYKMRVIHGVNVASPG